ncbi:MAG: methionine--tRNA ligase subunit beta, partial [Deltaproteobacteria bacterium]
ADLYARYWPADCHLIGKDILRFHAVYWPCFLLSAKLPLPKSIVVTGFWNVSGKKISKSIPATRVDPVALADDIGVDALRYFLLREKPLGLDGDFRYESVVGRYNAELANDLGNLLHRTITMTDKFCGGRVPAAGPAAAAELAALADEVAAASGRAWEAYEPSRALEEVWRLVRAANQYVDQAQPWKLAKAGDSGAVAGVMRAALEAVTWCALLMAPALPHKADEILARLGVGDADRTAQLSRWPEPGSFGTLLPAGLTVSRGEPLFPRIDDDRAEALYAKWMGDAGLSAPAADAAGAPPDAAGRPLVSFDDFQRLDLRVAQVVAAERVPKADRLLRLELDVGPLGRRQVVAGIAAAYSPEQLVGRKVIFLANLEPATIRGVRSEGMVLAAGDDAIVGLSAVDTDVPPGTIIR